VRPEELDEVAHEALVALPLPHEAVGHVGLAARPRGHLREFVERRRRMIDEVGAVVEHPGIDEPRERVEPPLHATGREGAREEPRRVGGEAVEREYPPGGGELGRPDHVELEHVRVAHPRVEPLDIELVALVGRVGRRALDHTDVRVRAREAHKLAAQHAGLGSDRAR
jgi:hypothetical protein